MRTSSLKLGTGTVALLLATHSAFAQHERHQGQAPRSSRGAEGASRAAGNVGKLLKLSDEALRGMERAVERSGPRLLGDAVQEFVGAMDALEVYFDADGNDPDRIRKDASKTERALERQGGRLAELSAQAPAEFRDGLSAALDACQRARDAAAAAYAEAQERLGPPAGGHHGGRGRLGGGCGHH